MEDPSAVSGNSQQNLLLTRILDKVDVLTETIADFKSDSSQKISKLETDFTQHDEKIKFLVEAHNDNQNDKEKIRKEIQDVRHDTANHKGILNNHGGSIETLEKDLNEGMKGIKAAVDGTNKRLDQKENQALGFLQVFKLVAGLIILLGAVGGFGAWISTLIK